MVTPRWSIHRVVKSSSVNSACGKFTVGKLIVGQNHHVVNFTSGKFIVRKIHRKENSSSGKSTVIKLIRWYNQRAVY